jgi:hypothetical protein
MSRLVHVGFVGDKVQWNSFFIQVLSFSPVSIIPTTVVSSYFIPLPPVSIIIATDSTVNLQEMKGMLINLVQKGNIISCIGHLSWTAAAAENGYMLRVK